MPKKFYYKYRALDGDRWDTIAHKFYGDAGLVPMLIADNTHLPATITHLPAGEIVFLREEVAQSYIVNTENIPPWRDLK